jgi:hypothetical protein
MLSARVANELVVVVAVRGRPQGLVCTRTVDILVELVTLTHVVWLLLATHSLEVLAQSQTRQLLS